jgi:hypothetical protein
MFQYEVLTEQQAMEERFQLIKEGEYDAVISASQDTHSANSGNPMMDLTVTVFDENGKPHDIRDFLVFTNNMMWKVRHLADSAGLLEEYEAQLLCSEVVIDKRVRVKVVVEQGGEIPQDRLKGKPLGSKYPDKNKIEDYVKKEDQKPLNYSKPKSEPFEDDDIAF